VCGFIGIVSKNDINNKVLEESNENIICRGPDETKKIFENSNTLFSNKTNLLFSLIFNRLSIVDLTENASQPMISKEFETLILFNGEIFNHIELRKDLERKGIAFNSDHSDTETALLGLSYYGVDYVNKFIGQFSIFFYNSRNNMGYLLRDRLGQKPLYYNISKDGVKFSSNFLSLYKNLSIKSINENSINSYIELGVIPSPETIVNEIKKVKPGAIIEIDFNNESVKHNEKIYWKPENFINNTRFSKEKFFHLFTDSVHKRLNSDVPIANFLSGGIDSTSIIKNLSDAEIDINSFSMGYNDGLYDESEWFEQVAEKYKTNQETKIIDIDNLDVEIDQAIDAFDEPYYDPSIVPSYLLSKAISQHYKVAISGDGGDELLGGYKRVSEVMNNKRNNYSFLPFFYNIYPSFLGTGNFFLSKSQETLTAYSSYFEDKKLLKLMKVKNNSGYIKSLIPPDIDDYKQMMIIEYKFYLPEMMMLKIDRTSMINSLEVRSPFVDHRLVEYMLGSSPANINFSAPKNILKEYLSEDFNLDFLNRKKMGFVFNVEGWIYNNNKLIENTLSSSDFIKNSNPNILNLLSINKSRINGQRIWKLYVLQKFLDKL
tara:strand:- start:14 stop:1819 length:1806 start_codon:yes stop_codon:yes gene_type:complete